MQKIIYFLFFWPISIGILIVGLRMIYTIIFEYAFSPPSTIEEKITGIAFSILISPLVLMATCLAFLAPWLIKG